MQRSWMRLFWLIVVLVGAIAGYLVSSGTGPRLLHREIETQLTRLLEGPVSLEDVAFRWEEGLRVEAREVVAYPGPPPDHRPALRARRVVASIATLPLLVGRLELGTLRFEGPHLHLERNAEGAWIGLPFPPPEPTSYPDAGLDDRSAAERAFSRLTELDGLAARFADDFDLADTIEIVDGTVEWRAAAAEGDADPEAPVPGFRIELLNGSAHRQWLSEEIALEAQGVFLDGVHPPFPFELGVHRPEDRHFVWNVSLARIPLEAAKSPLVGLAELGDFAGTLDARLRLFTGRDGLHRLSVSGEIADASVRLQSARARWSYERVALEAQLEIDPVEIRLTTSSLTGPRLQLLAEGKLQRPIRDRARLQVELRTENIELAGLRSYIESLPETSQTAATLRRLTDRVIGGHVRSVGLTGTSALARWRDLLSGRLQDLPSGFVLAGSFDSVAVASGPGERIEGLAGEIEWTDDQIVFRNGRGRYRGEALPELNAVVKGIQHLASTPESAREIRTAPPPLPGLAPLGELLRPRNPQALPPLAKIGLAFDRLEHPILRWPFEDLKVLIEPLRRGLEITVRDGRWGGAGVRGDVVWFDDPESPSLSANLELTPAIVPPSAAADPSKPTTTERWGQARFEAEFRPRRWLPFEHAEGLLRFEGDEAFFDDLDVRVVERGTFAARMALGLGASDHVGFDLSFALTDGRLKQIGPFIALPEDLATGDIEGSGALAGRLRPDTPFLAELEGSVRAEARTGRVKLTLPLLFRLAKASEGFTSFDDEDELSYETMRGNFAIDRGQLSVEDFEIEGPLRVYAGANIDTNARPVTIEGVVGVFLFRKPNAVLESLPIIRSFLPGSERGLIGTYFEVEGPMNDPDIDAMPLESLMTGVPDVIKAPFQVLRRLFRGDDDA